MIITLICYTCNYSVGWYAVHWRIDLSSILLLLCISKPHLVQACRSTRVAKHTRARMVVTAILSVFVQQYSVIKIHCQSTSTKYPALKLSSMSCSSALILAHIIKNNFNSAYCSCLIVTVSTSDWQLLYVCRRCKK